jgi:hypothetical protein
MCSVVERVLWERQRELFVFVWLGVQVVLGALGSSTNDVVAHGSKNARAITRASNWAAVPHMRLPKFRISLGRRCACSNCRMQPHIFCNSSAFDHLLGIDAGSAPTLSWWGLAPLTLSCLSSAQVSTFALQDLPNDTVLSARLIHLRLLRGPRFQQGYRTSQISARCRYIRWQSRDVWMSSFVDSSRNLCKIAMLIL